MKNATINSPERMNEFEMMLVGEYMEKTSPNAYYTMRPGNDCIWVTQGRVDMYFIFRDGKIADIQVD